MLLVTKSLKHATLGGREQLSKLNRDCLAEIYGDRLDVLELDPWRISGTSSIYSALHGYIDGLSDPFIQRACEQVREGGHNQIFIDGSNLGRLAAEVKQALPSVHVYTFFHNIEARFFWGAVRRRPSVHALGVMVANYSAERMAVRASGTLITLSKRDSDLMTRLYGRAATAISPMALRDKLPAGSIEEVRSPKKKRYLLFVGGAFYANRLGIEWFVHNVVPHIQVKTCVVGFGLDDYREAFEGNPKVEIVGGVDNLADWYRDAYAVIAPIFDGSGMKTKVAEALMFGKKIIGTPEAFSGYEADIDLAGWCCRTDREFADVINRIQEAPAFDAELRHIYESKYSYKSKLSQLYTILSRKIP